MPVFAIVPARPYHRGRWLHGSSTSERLLASKIHTLCRRVRWRLRWRSALSRAVVAGLAAGAVLLAVLIAARLRLIDTSALSVAALAAGAVFALALLSGLVRRISDLDAAGHLDRAAGLHDRLGSAIAFGAAPSPSPMQLAAIRDAEAHVDRADPRAAAPLTWPRGGLALLALAAALAGAWLLVLPVGSAEGRALAALRLPAPPQPERVLLRPEDRAALADEAARLTTQAAAIDDPDVKSWIAELNELVRALQEGRITPEEAHAQIARLQKAREEWSERVGDEVREVAEHAKKAAESVKRPHRETSPLLDALRAEQWAAAARAMRELRERTERGELGGKDARGVQKDLAALAESLKTESQQREERLKKERDRLKKKEEAQKDRFAARDRDRLKKTERQLEQLRRESESAGEARRQLERLQREMDRAAQDLARRGGQPQQQTAEQMRQAEDIMRRLGEMTEGQRQMRVAQGRLVDLEEMMRRAGQQRGQGKNGEGEGEGEKGEKGQLERFLVRAGGQDPQSGKNGQGKGEGEEVTLLMPGGAKAGGPPKPGGSSGAGQPSPGSGGGGSRQGDAAEGVGEGHDPRLFGARTEQRAAGIEDQVHGADSDGPSESRVIRSAASRGFATQSWKAVHQDYSEVVEHALERQEIPAGQRRYVRRYFDLIRPR
ncbi:MAG: hypothetical protein R3F39_18750 [Myxococcota bacterium]